MDITLESLEVEEGAKKTISNRYLNIEAADGSKFVFNVTKAPVRGQIDVVADDKVTIVRENATFFTSDEIANERVRYKHDDSESR